MFTKSEMIHESLIAGGLMLNIKFKHFKICCETMVFILKLPELRISYQPMPTSTFRLKIL